MTFALVLLLAASTALPASEGAVTVERVHGRCEGCAPGVELSRIDFANERVGLASAFAIVGDEPSFSQQTILLRTEDGGRTWMPIPDVQTIGDFVEPAFSLSSPTNGWVAWNDRIGHLRKTADGGRTWKSFGSPYGLWLALRVFDRNTAAGLLSTNDDALFCRTANGGRTWTTTPMPFTFPLPSTLFFVDRTQGWAAGTSDDGTHHLLRTTDGGEQWSEVAAPLHDGAADVFFADAQHGWLTVALNGSNQLLLRTDDGGRTWSECALPRSALGFLDAAFVDADDGVVMTNNGRHSRVPPAAFVTHDGGRTWTPFAVPSAVESCRAMGREVWCTSAMDLVKVRLGR